MDKPTKLTPMLKQYFDLKEKYKDNILFFRLGDFYEMFGDDAVEISKVLNLTLTARGQDESKIPMCGIPYHAARRYIARLTKLGKSVAICEQLTDPNLPGIVERDVVRVITPGTTFDEYLLDEKSNNFIASLSFEKDKIGFAFCDITTGQFQCIELQKFEELERELIKIRPSEMIMDREDHFREDIKNFLSAFKNIYLTPIFKVQNATNYLKEHFKIKNLEIFELSEESIALQPSANLIEYLKNTQKTSLEHIQKIKKYNVLDHMALDSATICNLELLFTIRENKKEGSLINVIDQTLTAMGARLIRSWLLKPLINKEKIDYRLEGVDEIYSNFDLKSNLEESIKNILDIERILGRIGCDHANARDLTALRQSLRKIPSIKATIEKCKTNILKNIYENLGDFTELTETLEKAILDEPSSMIKEGGMIREGWNKELDELRSITTDSKSLIQKLQEAEIARTGINSLKVRFNSVFGYYIEISKSNLNKVPDNYIRRQTLVNAERYITPELKEYEEKVMGAESKIMELEYSIFLDLRALVLSKIKQIQTSAMKIAQLDVLLNFAKIAISKNYTKPEITENGALKIIEGRHPVIESQMSSNEFVANDTIADNESKQIALITGPNMAGKSTYLRQTAIIVLLAQIGSFVPAQSAEISLTDRIFTRVGASDNLSKGQSTFMVEMQETSYILHNATEKSLIILDEIGRGTSTYDGLSIAWAIFEHLHDKVQAKTLFATHYHELIELAKNLPKAINLSVAVKEKDNGVIFLHKVVEGAIDRSYGIEVAKLAGLPTNVITRATEILKNLEKEENEFQTKKKHKTESTFENQISLFASNNHNEHKAIKALKEVDVNNLTPMQALQKLEELKGMD